MIEDDKNKMHPQDMRNLIIFLVVALGIWFVFDSMFLKPRLEAITAHQEQLAAAQEEAKMNPGAALALDASQSRPRAEILNETSVGGGRIAIDTPAIKGSIPLKAARLDDVSLKEHYKSMKKREFVDLFSPVGSHYPRYAAFGWVTSDKNMSVPDRDTIWNVSGDKPDTLRAGDTLSLYWENGQGLRFEREISVDDQYLFTVIQRVINNTGKSITLFPFSLIAQHGLPEDLYNRWIVHEGLIGYMNGELVELTYEKISDKGLSTINADSGWIAMTEHYWFTGIFPDAGKENKFRYVYTKGKTDDAPPMYQIDILNDGVTLANGESTDDTSHIYVGPKKLSILEEYGEKLNIAHIDLALDFGMFYFLTRPIYWLLHVFGDWVTNFGIAIIMLTIVVRILVFPLANTSYRSFAGLRKIAPKMHELRDKHKGDKEQLQKELVKLYEREKVNPMAGCLPILIQIPIFFALFKTLQISIEMRHAPFFGWIQDLSAPDPTSVFNLFGLLPYNVPAFLMIGAWPCMMLFFMILQKKMNPPPQDKAQKFMMDFMPFFITFILAKFPSGLVIYWTFSNALSVVQQYIIMKSMGVEPELFKSKAQKKREREILEQGVNPALEVAEEQVEKALFGDETTLEKAEREEALAKPKKVSKPKPKKSKKKKK